MVKATPRVPTFREADSASASTCSHKGGNVGGGVRVREGGCGRGSGRIYRTYLNERLKSHERSKRRWTLS